MNKVNRKYRKTLLLTALATSLSLSGCGKDNENNVKVYKPSTQEITTELQTTEETATEEMTNINNYVSLAEQSYNEYKDFYDSIGVNVPQIEKMIKIINDDFSNITEDNFIDTLDMIEQITLSDTLYQGLDNIDSDVNQTFIVQKAPKLSNYVKNENIKADLENYERIRDQITDSVNNRSITESDKELLRNAIIEMERAYNQNKGYMNSNIISEGEEYLQAVSKKNLVTLAAKVTGETEIKDPNGDIYPICTTAEETNVIAQYNMLISSGDNIPESIQTEYVNIKLKQIITKYEESVCTLQEEMYRKLRIEPTDEEIIKESNLSSERKDLLKQIKFALEDYQDEYKTNNDKKIKMLI